MWVSMSDYTDDILFGPQILTRIGDAYRKIRNTARFLLANLSDFNPETDMVPFSELAAVDRWILDRAARTIDRCRQAYEEYEYHIVHHRIMELCTVDLSATYLDISKDTMYTEAAASPQRRSAQTAMYTILRAIVGAMAPIIPFTAEEIYEAMPGTKERSIHLTEFPRIEGAALSAEESAAWERVLAVREEVTKVLERARGAQQIGQSLEADIALHGALTPETLLGPLKVDVAKVFIVSHVDFLPPEEVVGEVVDVKGVGPVAITIAPARGKKCGRCWQYREEVQQDGWPCARCQSVLYILAPVEEPTV